MRLFTAVDLPSPVIANLECLLATLRPTAKLKWSPATSLHITTKFIGEWPEERLGDLTAALAALPKRPAIDISVTGVGFFPNPHHPRVFWAGVHAADALKELAADTDRALSKLGIAAEDRAFSPHLTLGRVKEPVPLVSLRQTIAALPPLEFGAFTVDRFHLYQSRLNPAGSVYTKLSDFIFTEPLP